MKEASFSEQLFYYVKITAPIFLLSAVFLVPTSISLISKDTRESANMSHGFWHATWVLNLILSIGYIAVCLWILTVSMFALASTISILEVLGDTPA